MERLEPEPCPACEDFEICTRPCKKVERWINQDNTGYHSGIVKANAEQMDSSNEFVDIMGFHQAHEKRVG